MIRIEEKNNDEEAFIYTIPSGRHIGTASDIAIPGSSNEAHIQENFEIFDFELTDTEMQQIAAMDQNRRHSSY